MRKTRNILIVSLVLLLSGGALAFAHGGWGGWGGGYYGGHMMGWGPGYGMGPGMMYGNGYGPGPGGYGQYGNLTPEQQQRLTDTQQKFFNDTQKLRDQIRDKRFALNGELSKQNPDSAKIAQLQKDLSSLQGEFDQKALQHQLDVRKIAPEGLAANGPGFGRGFGQGYGPGYGPGYCGRW